MVRRARVWRRRSGPEMARLAALTCAIVSGSLGGAAAASASAGRVPDRTAALCTSVVADAGSPRRPAGAANPAPGLPAGPAAVQPMQHTAVQPVRHMGIPVWELVLVRPPGHLLVQPPGHLLVQVQTGDPGRCSPGPGRSADPVPPSQPNLQPPPVPPARTAPAPPTGPAGGPTRRGARHRSPVGPPQRRPARRGLEIPLAAGPTGAPTPAPAPSTHGRLAARAVRSAGPQRLPALLIYAGTGALGLALSGLAVVGTQRRRW
jgi:hypothetical protein